VVDIVGEDEEGSIVGVLVLGGVGGSIVGVLVLGGVGGSILNDGSSDGKEDVIVDGKNDGSSDGEDDVTMR